MTRKALWLVAVGVFCGAISEASALAGDGNPPILTHHYDMANTGVNAQETILTPATVSSGKFGKQFSYSVDGNVFAQPLYVPNLWVPGVGYRNVLFVVTMNASLYAFDTDCACNTPLWKVSFIHPPQVGLVTQADTGFDNVPSNGILSTPVIDPATGTIYLVVKTKENGLFYNRLHALDIHTHRERAGSPVEITKPGFVALRQLQRSALKLGNGHVYIAFASQGDFGDYHGYVFSYDEMTLKQDGIFNDTPTGTQAGIWMSGAGPAIDPDGYVYVATGNGTFDGASNLGSSIIKLTQGVGSLTMNRTPYVDDFFTPANQSFISANDIDLGSGGVVVLPPEAGYFHNLLVQGGKDGDVYLLNREDLGGFQSIQNNRVVSQFNVDSPILVDPSDSGVFDTPAFFNNTLYVAAVGDHLKAYPLHPNETFSALPQQVAQDAIPYPGATPVVSANGVTNGIVWLIDPTTGTAVLRAYDASNITHELFNSALKRSDRAGAAVRFTVPTVAHGKVFIGTRTTVDVFGMMNAKPSPCPSPSPSPVF